MSQVSERKDIEILIKIGESQKVEFKEGISASLAKEMVAFANAEGGKIFIGVNDAGNIVGFDTTNRLTATIQDFARNCDPPIKISVTKVRIGKINILILDIPEGDGKPYSCSDGYYLRVGPASQKLRRDELIEFIRKVRPHFFDEEPCPSFSYPKDFSMKAFRSFLDKTNIKQGSIGTLDLLRNLGVVAESRGKKVVFNNAGVLFFAKEPCRFIIQSEVTCVLFQSTHKADVLDRKDMRGPLHENVEQAMIFLKKHLSLRYEIKTLQRKEILELPPEALREAILNAVTHRDYYIRGSRVMVEIYRDRVEIVDPGELPPGMKRSDLGRKSVHRNPKLADLFHRMGEIEKVGSGIRRMNEAAKKAHVKPPRFEVSGFFVILFKRPLAQLVDGTQDEVVPAVEKTVEKTVEKILALIVKNPRITQKQLMKNIGLTRRGVEWNIDKLKTDGKIRRIGSDRNGYWKAIEK